MGNGLWGGAAALVCVLALTSSCARSGSEPTAVLQQDVISDANHDDGTPGFYFLPPMVPLPSTFGSFVPTAQPVVQIDKIELSPAGCSTNCIEKVVEAGVARWTRRSGSGGEHIRLH